MGTGEFTVYCSDCLSYNVELEVKDGIIKGKCLECKNEGHNIQ